jgi:hypothetical protein
VGQFLMSGGPPWTPFELSDPPGNLRRWFEPPMPVLIQYFENSHRRSISIGRVGWIRLELWRRVPDSSAGSAGGRHQAENRARYGAGENISILEPNELGAATRAARVGVRGTGLLRPDLCGRSLNRDGASRPGAGAAWGGERRRDATWRSRNCCLLEDAHQGDRCKANERIIRVIEGDHRTCRSTRG